MSDSARLGAFTMRVDCPACGQPVPVNAPSESAHCAACSRDFALPPEIFSELLLRFDDAYPAKAEPLAKGADAMVGELRVHATYHAGAPACEKCAAPLVLTAPPREGTVMFACVACGDPAACFPAPPWLRALVPTATHIAVSDASAAPGALASGPHHDASRPVLMACPGCGASLKLASDTARTLSCAFCKNDVYLPDELWRRLHPPRTMAPWFVRFEGLSRGQIARNAVARFEAKEEERRDVEVQRGAAMSDLHAEAVAEIEAMKEADAAAKKRNGVILVCLVVLIIFFFVAVFGYLLASGKLR